MLVCVCVTNRSISCEFWSTYVGVKTSTSKTREEKRKRWKKATTSTTTCYISMVQTMFLTRHHYRFVRSAFLLSFLLTTIDSCNIWKASDCPQPPTADDEEIVGDQSLLLLRLLRLPSSSNTISTPANNSFNSAIKERSMPNAWINDCSAVIWRANTPAL